MRVCSSAQKRDRQEGSERMPCRDDPSMRPIKGQDMMMATRAATLMQRAWLKGRLQGRISALVMTGVIERMATADLETMQRTILQRDVILAAQQLMEQLVRSNDKAAELIKSMKGTSNSQGGRLGRVFLMALFLMRHGGEVLKMGEEDGVGMNGKCLHDKAIVICNDLLEFIREPTRTRQQDLSLNLAIFARALEGWQRESKPQMLEEMLEEYMRLESLLAQLDPGSLPDWNPPVRKYQQRLRHSIGCIAGKNGLERLSDMLDDLKRPSEQSESVTVREDRILSSPVLPSPIDRAAVEGALGRLTISDTTISNLRIAHELAIDDTFDYRKLMELATGKPYDPEDEQAIKGLDVQGRSFVANPNVFLKFVLLVKRQLVDMVQRKGHFADELEAHFEEAFLQDQLDNGALDANSLLLQLVEIMSRMCAPAQDAHVKRLRRRLEERRGRGEMKEDQPAIRDQEYDSLTEDCRQVANILQLMHEDLANFVLSLLRPKLRASIVAYEREWLWEREGESFKKTLNLDSKTSAKISESPTAASATPNADALIKKYPITCETIHGLYSGLQDRGAVLVELFLGMLGFPLQDAVMTVKMPSLESYELLKLDITRMTRLGEEFMAIVRCSALVLALRNLGHRLCEDGNRIERLFTLLLLPNASMSSLLAEIECMASTAILPIATRILSSPSGDPIVNLLLRRLGALLRSLLSEASPSAGASKPAAVLLRHGLANVTIDRFNRNAELVLRVFCLHRNVHAPIYDHIMDAISR